MSSIKSVVVCRKNTIEMCLGGGFQVDGEIAG